MTEKRTSRGSNEKHIRAICTECGERCKPEVKASDQRMWAQRHANQTGHHPQVEQLTIRKYQPQEEQDAERQGK